MLELSKSSKVPVKSVWPYIAMVAVLAILLALTMTFRKYLGDFSAGTLQGLFMALIPLVIYIGYQEARMAIVTLGRSEALRLEIQANCRLVEESVCFCDQILDVPASGRKTVSFIPLYTDAWKATISSGLSVAINEDALRKLIEAYQLIYEANHLLEYSEINIELTVHTPVHKSSWSSNGTYLPRIVKEKLTTLLGLLRELEKLL